ncbi:NAD(P)H-quinone oxidoreductase subunit 3 chloroplastic [Bienertia sinuspersici]
MGDAWLQFRIRYYMFALVFVVFDVKTVFLYPWAMSFDILGVSVLNVAHFKCVFRLWKLLLQERHLPSWMFGALIDQRYACDGNYLKDLFKARFRYSPREGHYFETIKQEAGYEIESREYKALIKIVGKEHFKMFSLNPALFGWNV